MPSTPDSVTGVPDLIVTRHFGAVEWLSLNLPCPQHGGVDTGEWSWGRPEPGDTCLTARAYDYQASRENDSDTSDWRVGPFIRAEVKADDVRGKHVVGNLPLHLAALCASVTAIEFDGPPPRGAEYTAEDMKQAGARLRRYVVTPWEERR